MDVDCERGQGHFGKPVFQLLVLVWHSVNSIRRRIVADAYTMPALFNHGSKLCLGREHQMSTEGCLLEKVLPLWDRERVLSMSSTVHLLAGDSSPPVRI